jgi:glycine dehydrogenase subunit 1
VIKTPISSAKLEQKLAAAGILSGYRLEKDYPGLDNAILFCVTETRTKAEIDELVAVLKEVQA